jgi:hypothetical protein
MYLETKRHREFWIYERYVIVDMVKNIKCGVWIMSVSARDYAPR